MRRRTLLESKPGGGPDGSTATPLSVVLAKKSDSSLIIVDGNSWSSSAYPSSAYTPVGIVVIPGEHGVLKSGDGKTNQCGVMSIVPMSYSSPETGATSETSMYWGYNSLDISSKSDSLGRYDSISYGLRNYNNVITTSNNTSNTGTALSSSTYAHIPRQAAENGTPTRSSSPYAPSPYAGSDYKSGAYNTSYGTTSYDSGSNYNALADFGGIVNTKIITDLSTSWKTGSISNSYNTSGVYPAAQTCARYHTTGTKAFKDCTTDELKNGTGFWYLPAAGELGYIVPRLYDINATITKLNGAYGVGVLLGTNNLYWSSSEYSDNGAYGVYTGSGGVNYGYKYNSRYVRAFLRL